MFAEKLKELRKQKPGLTQAMLAKQLGIAKTTYSSYEQGKRQPDYDMLLKIANYFDVTTDYLLGINNTPKWANNDDVKDLKELLDQDDEDNGFSFQGEKLTDEEMQRLKLALTQIFWDKLKSKK